MNEGRRILGTAVLMAAMLTGSASASLVRYGRLAEAVGETIANPGVNISWSGDYQTNEVQGASGTFINGTAGSTLTALGADLDTGSNLVFSIDSVAAPVQTDVTKVFNAGHFLSIGSGAGADNMITSGESATFSFSEPVVFRYINVHSLSEAGAIMNVAVDGVAVPGMTGAVSGNTEEFSFGDLQGTSITISSSDASGTGKGWTVQSLVVETPPIPPIPEVTGISVVDRVGSDVSGQTLIDSDLMHIEVTGTGNVSSYVYRVVEQVAEPTTNEWNSASERPFSEEMYFYRKPETQWVQVAISETNGVLTTQIHGLAGGMLTAPPDDPVLPADLTAMMGTGFDVSWYNPGLGNFSEEEIVAVKAGGFGHIRIREEKDATESGLFNHLDDQVELVLRHGLVPVLCRNAAEAQNDSSDAVKDLFVDWWSTVSQRYQYTSHRFAFDFFTEIGGTSTLSDWSILNSWFAEITAGVRTYSPTRNVIYCPNSLNDPTELPNLVVPASAGDYYFAEWHILAGGPMNIFGKKYWTTGTSEEKARIDNAIAAAVDWSTTTGKPTWFGAWMPGDYLNFDLLYAAEQIGFSTYLIQQLDAAGIPSACNAMPSHFYDMDTEAWRPERIPVLEALNREASMDPDDMDGDGLTNDDEINHYGTNPQQADTDQDNILDGQEIQYGFDPLDASDGDPSVNYDDDGTNDVLAGDYDGDGMNNAKEIHYGLNPRDASDALLDNDGDGLNNLQEIIAITDPDKYITRQTSKLRDGVSDLDFDGYGAINEFLLNRDPRLKWGETPHNTVPAVSDDNLTVPYKNWPVIVDVLSNDSDANGDPLNVYEVAAKYNEPGFLNQSKQGGAVTINADNTLRFTPKPNYSGSDTIYYVASDGKGYSVGTVNVTVRNVPPSSPPVAGDDVYTAMQGVLLTIPVSSGVLSNDVGISSVNLIESVKYGVISLDANGSFSYTPNELFWGWDQFRYGSDGILPATVTIAIQRTLEDSDGDGIDDRWELHHAGDLSSMDGESHSDADGVSDMDEYLADTDPTDADSAFKISVSGEDKSNLNLIWPNSVGKRYRVMHSTNLFSWVELAVNLSTGSNTHVLGLDTSLDSGFYKIQIQNP